MLSTHFSHRDHRQIAAAAQRYGVSAGLVAAIWQDELTRLDLRDYAQHAVALGVTRLPVRLSRTLQLAAETLTRRSLSTHSIGPAQMKPGTLRELGASGLLDVPTDLGDQLRVLLDRDQAPHLIAARVRQTINHWALGGVNLTHRPEILGTLYSLGLTGESGVHAHPQATQRGQAIADTAYRYAPPVRQRVAAELTA